ncbi:MAG: hypothetical protein AAFV25_20505 [Bacteroidota bacterium]
MTHTNRFHSLTLSLFCCCMLVFSLGLDAQVTDSPSPSPEPMKLDTTASGTKTMAGQKKIQQYKRNKTVDFTKIKQAQSSSPLALINDYQLRSGLKKANCSLSNGHYQCVYTSVDDAKDGQKVEQFLQKNKFNILRQNLKIEQSTGTAGHPEVKLYKSDGNLFMIVKAKEVQSAAQPVQEKG